jgi:KDO2-lipid IV(A) lauroyltransferase
MVKPSLKHRLEWIGVRFFYASFEFLGRHKASRFGGWLARKIGPLLSVDKLARKNMKLALPQLSDREIEEYLTLMWDNLGRNVGELSYIKEIMLDPSALEVVGQEYIDIQEASGKGAFFVTAHYGPWELVGMIGKLSKTSTMGIYRAANNPLVDEFFQSWRIDPDYAFAPKGNAGARAILKFIKQKGKVILLNDQKTNTGIAVPFFGRDAMTAPAIAEIAYKKDVPIYPMRAERLEDGKFRLTIYPSLDLPRSGNTEEDVFAVLKSINEIFEDWITERPDHWFWVHNRWP